MPLHVTQHLVGDRDRNDSKRLRGLKQSMKKPGLRAGERQETPENKFKRHCKQLKKMGAQQPMS